MEFVKVSNGFYQMKLFSVFVDVYGNIICLTRLRFVAFIDENYSLVTLEPKIFLFVPDSVKLSDDMEVSFFY